MSKNCLARPLFLALLTASAFPTHYARAQQAAPAAVAEASDKAPAIVATVNGEPITRDELATLCLTRYGTEVLDNVLNKYLILQACQSQNIKITQKDVDDEIGRIAGKFKLSTKLYLQLIEEERDITPEQYSADIVWPMLALRALAVGMVHVDAAEIQRAIDSEFGAKVQVRMIAVTDAAKAADLHAKAVANPDAFKALAKEHSEDPASASVEGILPPIRKVDAADPLESAAFALQPGQVSPVFKIGEMCVFLQCVRHLPAAKLTPDQLPAIEERFRSEIQDQQLRDQAETMFATLRAKSSVKVVFNNPELTGQYPGVAAVINDRPIPMKTLEDECIKRFGPAALELEINRRIVAAAVAQANVKITDGDLTTEIARAADYFGFLKDDGSPDVDAWMEKVLAESKVSREVYLQDAVWPTVALKKLIADQVVVTEEDLTQGFEHDYGPRAEVLAIVCSNQRVAQEVWQMARDNPSEQFFGQLAAQYSVEPTSRNNDGKIPPVRQHGGSEALEKAAFALQVGEMSGIIEIGQQYIILKGQGRTKSYVSDPAAVRGELSKDILERKQRKAMHERLTKLVADAAIDNFLVPKSQLGRAATAASLQELKGTATR